MRRFFIASMLGCAVLASGAPARAADMPLKAPPLPPPCDWCGGYLGVNVGVDWGHSTVSPYYSTPFPPFGSTIPGVGIIIVPASLGGFPSVSGNATSVIGGGQAGYNWQTGHWVYGLEGDIDGTGLREKSTSTLSRVTLAGTQTVTANLSANINWIATARARLGYAADRTLLYVTGGVAGAGTTVTTNYAETQSTIPLTTPTPLTASSSHAIAGWTAGAGAEWKLDKAWGIGLEYRHTDFSRHGYNLGYSDAVLVGTGVAPTNAVAHFTEDQVTARLNYHFH
jgi:outer membrane immunogenic protein